MNSVRQGLRHEGLFCALFVFFGKLAAGVALAGSNVMLEIAGFNVEVDGTDQPPPLSRPRCSLSELIDVLRASEGSLFTRLHRMRREALLLLTGVGWAVLAQACSHQRCPRRCGSWLGWSRRGSC